MVAASSSVELSSNEYVSHLVALPNAVVAGLTDGTVHNIPIAETSNTLPSKGHVSVVTTPGESAPMAGLLAIPSMPMTLASCDTNGHLQIIDLRMKNGSQSNSYALKPGSPVTALGVSNFGEIALGTEASPDAEISIYDVRQIKSAKPLVKYTDSHNDDITDLQFHPTFRHRMVSGSTDGIVNLFDITVQDEDDAVIEAYNCQASIHRTGFFTDTSDAVRKLRINDAKASNDKVFALSHMETLTVYEANLNSEKVETDDLNNELPCKEYGDLREAWGCQYVADYCKQHFMVGSNDEQWASLVPIVDGAPQSRILLEGGHGEEVIRCFDLRQTSGICFTGGEDGVVKLWDVNKELNGAPQQEELAKSETTKISKRSRADNLESSKPHKKKSKSSS